MQPTLEHLRTARDSARRRRNHNAARLRRVVLKICARIEAYEHELALLSRVEGQIVAGGRATEEYSLPLPLSAGRTETRFDVPPSAPAVLTPQAVPDASSAIRRAAPMPAVDSVTENQGPISADAWAAPETAEMTAAHYASGDAF
jgi:hypothetical protein